MVTAPNRAPGNIDTPTSGLLSSMMSRFERPTQAANNNAASTVVSLANRREALNGTAIERNWLQRMTIDRFVARTEVESELGVHSADINGDLSAVTRNVADLSAVWNNDRQLKRRIDQYQRYNRKYGDQARHIVELQIEGGDDTEAVLDVIDENSTPEEIKAIKEQQEKNRLKEEAIERWGEFAVQAAPGGRWRSKKLFESALGWKNIKNSWQNRTSMWSFFKGLGGDYAQWKAVKSAIPAVNVVSYGVREGQEVIEAHRETGEAIAQGVETVVGARATQKAVRREGAEAVVLTTEAARSGYIQEQMRRLMRGDVSRSQVLSSTKAAFSRFERQDPQAFARMIKGYGLTARRLNTKAGFYELFKNAALWYTPWSDRGERSFLEANETAIPIWGSYAAWRDINVDNGLPLWSRIGFATVGTALDVGTVLSFGTLTPLMAGAKVALVKGGQAVARKTIKDGAQRAAVAAGSRGTSRTLAQVMGSLPRAARKAVTGAGAKGFALSAAGYTALSAGVDWLFDLEDRVADAAFLVAEVTLGQDFSYQQQRLLREVGQDLKPIMRKAYADYREESAEEKEEEVAANDNQAPTEEGALNAGQTADVLAPDEEKIAA